MGKVAPIEAPGSYVIFSTRKWFANITVYRTCIFNVYIKFQMQKAANRRNTFK
jgi:hypothetical protein